MISHPTDEQRTPVAVDPDPSGSESALGPASAHSVSLIRRPSLAGRIALWAAIALGIGPGGAYLFRVTQAIFADDAQVVAEGATDAQEQSNESDRAAEPTWDLTQQANEAWMVVERPAASGATSTQARSVPLVQDDGVVPVLNLDPARTPIPLLGTADDLSASALEMVPPPNAPLQVPAAGEVPQVTAENAIVPAEDAIAPRENVIVLAKDAIAQSQDAQLDPADEYIHKAVPAPLAPPADSEPLPAVIVPPREALPAPPQQRAIPELSAEPKLDELATQPVYVDLPAEKAAPAPGIDTAMSTIGTPAAGFGTGGTAICGVHCNGECACQDLRWKDSWLIPWEVFAQGEYIGPSRMPHVPEYRLRVDDRIEFVYRLTGEKSAGPYRINTGDNLLIESLTSENLNREALVQPDGTISLSHLGQVLVAGRTIEEVRSDLEARYTPLVRNPSITVTPIKVNSVLEELRATVDGRFGNGGQSRIARVTPEGTVQLPAIGSVPAHGLTLAELRAEIQYRYADIVNGLEVTPILHERAPRYVYVLGEVRAPGRYTLEGPTSLMQSIALAGGWNVGANLKEVVVFRRDDCWRLMATRIGIRRSLYGKDPCPDGEIWLRDSDIVVVPKAPILVVDEFIDLVFTRGVYGVVPWSTNLSYVRNLTGGTASVVPIP